MVLRKPVPASDFIPPPSSPAMNHPPYPITPLTEEPPPLPSSSPQPPSGSHNADPNRPPAFTLNTMGNAQKPKEELESDDSEDDWEKEDLSDSEPEIIPAPLKVAGKQGSPISQNTLPDSLRAGPPPGMMIRKAPEAMLPDYTGVSAASYGSTNSNNSITVKSNNPNNPYLRMQATGQSQHSFGGESSTHIWGDMPSSTQKHGEVAELPAMQSPITPPAGFSQMSLNDNALPPTAQPPSNPPVIAVESPTPASAHPRQNSDPVIAFGANGGVSSIDELARDYRRPAENIAHEDSQQGWQEEHVWQQDEKAQKEQAPYPTSPNAVQNHQPAEQEHWAAQAAGTTSIAAPPGYPSVKEPEQVYQQSPYANNSSTVQNHQPVEQGHWAAQAAETTSSTAPPGYTSAEVSPPKPAQEAESSRQHPPLIDVESTPPGYASVPASHPKPAQEPDNTHQQPQQPDTTPGPSTSRPEVESPGMVFKKKKEHYQIKHIRWYDSACGIRESPILTQNENGPCPLLALVNALVLSTPANEHTTLNEVLRTREQVSLGLLLDAVFDELMSGRRGGAALELPDVTELYKFLVTLHTGMNVNPMFISTDGPSTSNSSNSVRAGGFENTREMRLYRTFDIPLVHGWLPEAGSEAYIAFERVAKTYEDAQNVQFQEEELNSKLAGDGLNEDEQRLFTDLIAIKEFLGRWPTQLTDFGLQTIQRTMLPGQIGILFRNDHFLTLYKHPTTQKLLTLVTDAGYSSHAEIVWESLGDVSGKESGLFSGDFRPVGGVQVPGHIQPARTRIEANENQRWAPEERQRQGQGPALSSTPAFVDSDVSTAPDPKKTEQEDADLALALQLQDEEEDRLRRSTEERRRRENQLSEEVIASQARAQPQNRATPRPGQAGRQGQNPPLIPPRRNNAGVNRRNSDGIAAPPTYEEASQAPAYRPTPGQPAPPNAGFRPPAGPPPSNWQTSSPPLPPRQGRLGRRTSAGNGGSQEDKDRCVVM